MLNRVAAGLGLVAAIAMLAACTPHYVAQWGQLTEGMTRADVEEILGRPSAKVLIEQRGSVLSERWEYGRPRGAVTTGIAPGAPDDVFVVYFGNDGRVSDTRRALFGRYAEPGGD